MSKLALSRPITRGTFTYAYRNTGEPWSGEIAITGGVNMPTRNFVSPVCDELRITGTLLAPETINRLHVCGLNVLSGLSFDLSGAGSIGQFAQSVYEFPNLRQHRQTIQFEDNITDSPTVVITGIAQQRLNFRQLTFAEVGYQTEDNFVWESPKVVADNYVQQLTGSSAYMYKDTGPNTDTLNFEANPDIDYRAMKYFIDQVLINRLCLFERDTSNSDHEYSYMARVAMSQVDPLNVDLNNFNLNFTEAF